MLSSKNSMMSGAAATDLGLGDQLKNQVESELQLRKKKLLQNAGLGQTGAMAGTGPAVQSLFTAAGGFNG